MKINNISHDSANSHVRGKSEFVDDRIPQREEIYVDYFGSPVAHGTIKNIFLDDAKQIEGVLGLYVGGDLHHNKWGAIFEDQAILADNVVRHVGEPIVIIAAKTKEAAKQAKERIKVEIEPLKAILSIDDAIKKESFLLPEQKIISGDVEATFKSAPHILEGTFVNEGQDHFYLESQATVAYPHENNSIELLSSTQNPTETQHVVAKCLGITQSRVVCKVKRMGGGFGGKESQSAHFAVMASFVAYKHQKPARIILSKDDDMISTGKRHPFKTFYKVAFDNTGKILGLRAHLYADGGAYTDLTGAIVQRAILHIDNTYFIPSTEIIGFALKTHYPSNTAYRGFGAPQGIAVMENIIEDIAVKLSKDPMEIRRINFYGDTINNVTPYGQVVEHNTINEITDRLMETSHYHERKIQIENFNKNSKTHVKGISFSPVKFGISFTSRFLNQGNAYVTVHLDGSIQVSTGATEMGQGVNVKIAQIVSETFGLPVTSVRMMYTSTEKNHNTSPTAASSGSDINGAAALKAANSIRERLASLAVCYFKNKKIEALDEYEIDLNVSHSHIQFIDGMIIDQNSGEQISFAELLKIAYFNRISLAGYAFYKTPGIGFDKEKGKGHPFLYYTNGASVSEVLIDRFTGEAKVLKTDILMDLGRPINEGIDIGQITGAFIQGMGWVTTEKQVWKEGAFLSHSPTTYKIPNIQDIPREFKIDLIDNDKNIMNVRGSKAVGEPPFVLALSVFFAVKDAIRTLKKDKIFNLSIPASNDEILNSISPFME